MRAYLIGADKAPKLLILIPNVDKHRMDLEQMRFKMIEQQIRPWEVLDHRVLDLLAQVHREEFVPERYKSLAFVDMNIPLGHNQVMMSPKMEARLLQALDIQPTDIILEVGTGSGYLTALLASLGQHVDSIEIFPEFTASAQKKLTAHGFTNTHLETGDAARGWAGSGLYDAVVLTGSLPVFTPVFQEQLKMGGRLFMILGMSPAMEAVLITRVEESEWVRESLFETDIPPLLNAPQPQRFIF